MTNLIKPLVVTSLKELADCGFQRRVWLASAGPEVSSFVEATCGLFDDSGLGNALDADALVFSPHVDSLFLELREELSKIDHNRAPETIINDPRMDRVRAIAAELLVLLLKAIPVSN